MSSDRNDRLSVPTGIGSQANDYTGYLAGNAANQAVSSVEAKKTKGGKHKGGKSKKKEGQPRIESELRNDDIESELELAEIKLRASPKKN